MLPHPMPSNENIAVTIAGQVWKRVESFEQVGPDERVFALNSETGVISFGDGVRGSRPPVGATIEAAYRQGDQALSVSLVIPDPNLRKASLISVRVVSSSLQFSHYQTDETSWRWKLMLWLCELLKM